ncbi:MAG TPA: amino acid permease [Longimicrobiales bacterium]
MASLQAEADAGTLHRALGPVHLTALGIGAVIGAGIFVLTGQVAAEYAGPAVVLSFVLAGFACAFAGLCYAEFASMIPVAGSAYTYAYATLGELFAWIIGWDLILEYAVSASTVAVGWSGYFASLLGGWGIRIPPHLLAPPGTEVTLADGSVVAGMINLPAAAIVLLLTALLIVGIRESARANAVIVAIKLFVIMLFIVIGARFVAPENLTPLVPANTGEFGTYGWSGILRGAGVIFFAYIGFDAVSTAAQEARNPQRDLPIGILLSLAICTVLYILVALVLVGVVPYDRLAVPDPIAVGVDAMGLEWLSPLIKLGALAGLSSVILVQLLGQSRIFFAMSRDGLLPNSFARIHPRFRTPWINTAIIGVVVAVGASIAPLSVLAELVSIGTLLAFVMVCAGVLVLRRSDPDAPRPFRVPFSPWIPILGIVFCLYLMIGLPGSTWLRLVGWLAIGFVIYVLYGRRNARRTRLVSHGESS